MRRALGPAALLLAALCVGCVSSGDSFRVASLDASSISLDPTATVFTTRNSVKGNRSPFFGTERARKPAVAQIQYKSPYDGGAFSLASVGLGDWSMKGVAPLPNGLSWSRDGGRRNVLIYVHGFNQNFETTALDAARLSDGIKFRGDTILFSWPSKAGILDYIYDRESAMWSRDAFENMLDELITHPAVGNIHIVAHSMGTTLAVESLRQLVTRRGQQGTRKIGAIVLASPDIDLDVFSSSVTRLGNLRDKITVVIATNDRALGILTRMGGGVTRVGATEKPQLEAMGLRVIDASQAGSGGVNHDLFLSNAQIRRLVRTAIEEENAPSGEPAGVAMGTGTQ